MKIVGIGIIQEFAKEHADARTRLARWVEEVKRADWQRSDDIKASYPSASFLSDNRVVFNIKGNNYRLLIHVLYQRGYVTILQIGTHAEYDKWKP